MLFEKEVYFLSLVREEVINFYETMFIIVIMILLIIFDMPYEYPTIFASINGILLQSMMTHNLLSSENLFPFLDIRILFILIYNQISKFQSK